MARRIRGGAVDCGRYWHPGEYRKLLRESCHAHVFCTGCGLTEPDAENRVCPDIRLRLNPQFKHLFKDGDRWVEELFEERLAEAKPITAEWVAVVRSSVPGARDGIIEKVRDPVPHPMFENRNGKFLVTVDDIITPAESD